MTLPVSGAISFNNINVELGVAGTTQASLGQSSYRTLAGVASGAISMSNFYGKSNRVAISYTFSTNTANASLNLSTISGYAAGTSDITVTINSGVYLYATSTSNAGLTLTGGTTGDTITLVNNGYIMGKGGDAPGGSSGIQASGNPGGTALSLGFNTTVNNTNSSAYIGGGGGSGGSTSSGQYGGSGGGGAGGGNGGNGPNSSFGGAGGGIGSVGSNATPGGNFPCAGAGGGRIFPGTGGSGAVWSSSTVATGGGAGGGGGAGTVFKGAGGGGGNGGAGNASGGGGNLNNNPGGGGGGGWGASGGASYASGNVQTAGGSGGKAVSLNGFSITWTSGDTTRVYGAVS